MKPKHTPAPWSVEGDHASIFVSGPDKNAAVVCDVVLRQHDAEPTEEDEANAHLIAAAPNLLAALSYLRNSRGCFCKPTSTRVRGEVKIVHFHECLVAQAAIEKATRAQATYT